MARPRAAPSMSAYAVCRAAPGSRAGALRRAGGIGEARGCGGRRWLGYGGGKPGCKSHASRDGAGAEGPLGELKVVAMIADQVLIAGIAPIALVVIASSAKPTVGEKGSDSQ